MTLDGKFVAAEIRKDLRIRVEDLKKRNINPCLAVVQVGEDPASKIYVRNKRKACKEIGIEFRLFNFDEGISNEELARRLLVLNADRSVHAIIVQLPLPGHISEDYILGTISQYKDADGFHVANAGNLLIGHECTIPCTPAGCMELLRRYDISLDGKEAVVIGRSNIVGKPMALLLQQENCTVTMCHSHTKDLAEHIKRADIVVSAAGKPKLITGDMIKDGAVVIDVGINRGSDGKIVGDVDYESVSKVAGWITPVPGGVGPMTVTMLMKNVVDLATDAME